MLKAFRRASTWGRSTDQEANDKADGKPAATGMDSVGSPGKGVRQSKPRKGASKREILMESTMLKWAPVFSDIEKRREDVKSIRSFMEALGTLQSSYASGLKRLSEHAQLSTKSSLSGGWNAVKSTIEDLAAAQSKIAADIQNRILVGITDCKRNLRLEQEKLLATTTKMKAELLALRQRHDRRKKIYFDLAEKAHVALSAERKARAEGAQQRRQDKLTAATAARIKEAETAHTKYRDSVANLKQGQKAYMDDSKSALSHMKNLEKMRVVVCKTQLQTYAGFRKLAAGLEARLAKVSGDGVAKVDIDKDLGEFAFFLDSLKQDMILASYEASPYQAALEGSISGADSAGETKEPTATSSVVATNGSSAASPKAELLVASGGKPTTNVENSKYRARPASPESSDCASPHSGVVVAPPPPIPLLISDTSQSGSPDGTSFSKDETVVESETAHSAPPEGDAVAIHEYRGLQQGHLKLRVGDEIKLVESKAGADWWVGVVGSEMGKFPSYFARVRKQMPDSEAPDMVLCNARATRRHVSSGPNELGLEVGEDLFVSARGAGWYVGSKIGSGETGVFPAKCCKLIESS